MNSKNDLYPVQQIDTDFYKFLEVKTEKLVTAVYMITNFLSDKEPIKWRLRDVSLSMLSTASVLKEKTPAEQTTMLSHVLISINETLSLLEIAHLSGFISKMNYSVLRAEYETIEEYIGSVPEIAKMTHKVALPKELFEAAGFDIPTQQNNSHKPSQARQDESQSRNGYTQTSAERRVVDNVYFPKKDNMPNVGNVQENMSVKKDTTPPQTGTTPSAQTYGKVEKVKNKRREVIVQMLKDKTDLTIKDIASEITDCSEKTIQRELVALVDSGIVKRTGERRWSRYSLAA